MASQAQQSGDAQHITPTPASSTGHFVRAGDLKLHYLDYGTPGLPPMLCIHGGAGHAHWYDFVAPGFNKDYHVLSVDLRGHGDSEPVDPPAYSYSDYAADLDKAVVALGLDQFVLMGHSMGGMVSLVYSATYPGRVAKLVIVDTSMNLPPERIALMRGVGEKPLRDYDDKEDMVSRFKLRPGDSLATPQIVRYVAERGVKEVGGKWQYKFDRLVYATREPYNAIPLWDKIKIPALLVKGDRSERISQKIYDAVKARAPQVELVEVSSSDHHITLDNPTGFIEKVRPFLQK
jgi:pimeloyl-ACP methyl ester carboxylesterase